MAQTYESMQDAHRIAAEVLAGAVQPNQGCGLIAEIGKKLGWPCELARLIAVAHDQEGHEYIGITAESCVPDILDACRELMAQNGGAMDFNRLPLHDATLRSILVDWENKLCTLECQLSSGTRYLKMAGVTSFSTTLQDSWGSSSSILLCSREGDSYHIKMQSGDEIAIVATLFTFD